jgi:hypothetical protein
MVIVRLGLDGKANDQMWNAPYVQGQFQGRIACRCDGNHNDPDDWAASSVTLAILAEAPRNPGAQPRPRVIIETDAETCRREISRRGCEKMVLAPSGNGESLGKSAGANVPVPISSPPRSVSNGLTTRFTASKVKRVETIHVILRLQDDGQPPRCPDRRAVVTMRP